MNAPLPSPEMILPPKPPRGPALRALLRRYGEVFRQAWACREELAGPRRLAGELAFLPAALSIQETPAHPSPRRTMWAICLLFTVALVWATLGKIDVVAVAPGRIVVSERSKVIQPLEAATIRSIHVRDGETVREGQLLVEMDDTTAGAEHVQTQQELNKASSERLRAEHLQTALASGTLKLPVGEAAEHWCAGEPAPCEPWRVLLGQLAAEWDDIRAKRERLAATIQTRAAQIQATQAAVARLQALVASLRLRETDYGTLARQGFVNRHALQDKSRDRLDTENELVRVRAELEATTAAHREATKEQGAYLAEIRKNLAQREADARREIDRLTQEQVKTGQKLHLLQLRTPVAGTVQQLAVHTDGGVVTPAQPLMVIVPADSDLTAEVMVANKDIGFVRPGQSVRIKLETFNFTRYGTLDGEVSWVSADALTRDPQGGANATNPASNGQAPLAYFPAHVRLKQKTINVDGKELPVTPGLNVNAEIKTERRTVLEYLLSPIRRTLDESVRER